uniref:Ig-like domain-containing protein n=1 Tax=Neogobius melanostomus TaxID=47308 RepID=A0A8C6WLU6_9GOBI
MESALCTLLSALVVLLCSSPECKGEDTVTQPEGDASVFKGHTATINCTFETSDTTPTLFWYKQEGHGAPQYMMKRTRSSSKWLQTFKSTEFDESRFEIEADLKGNSVYLKIQDVRVSDSAVYYCALRPQ